MMRKAAFLAVLVFLGNLLGLVFVGAVEPSGAQGPTQEAKSAPLWLPPVEAPVVDGFRPSRSGYGPGNYGLEYGTTAGQQVSSVAAGRVVFVGLVAGERHIVVEHANDLKSTYAFVDSSVVIRGQRVVKGQQLGFSSDYFHLTARRAGRYLDPSPFIRPTVNKVRLIAEPAFWNLPP